MINVIYIYGEYKEVDDLIRNNDLKKYKKVTKKELSTLDNSSLLIIFYKGLNLEEFNEIEKNLDNKQKYMYIWSIFNYIFVSNFRYKNDKGCINCLFKRWITTKKDSKELMHMSTISNVSSEFEIPLAVHEYITKFIQKYITILENKILVIEKNKMVITEKQLLPVSTCQHCGSLENDDRVNANKDLEELKKEQKKFRKYSLDEVLPKLMELYVDEEIGVINYVLDDVEAPFAVAVANLPSITGKDEVGVGRTNDYSKSRAIAILEALERYCGLEPRGKRTCIVSSYDEIDPLIAIDPLKLGMHTDEQYENLNCVFKKFDKKEKLKWVYGVSATFLKVRLVPEKIAYYGLRLRDNDYSNFVYEISNGCAVGGTLKEASLSGLLEVIERDAFLNVWYNQISLKELDFAALKSQEILLMKLKFEYLFSYELHVFDMRLDINIPLVLVVAKSLKESDESNMNLMCAAGIAITWKQAIMNALHELCDIYPALNQKFKVRRDELERMSSDFMLVRTMEDHSLLYGLKKMEQHFSFLLRENRYVWECIPKTIFDNISTLDKVFEKLVGILRDQGFETIVINQTAEELKKGGLYCVKVLVPGFLPMTFGHINRRVENIERLHTIGKIFGAEQNRIIPHPFP